MRQRFAWFIGLLAIGAFGSIVTLSLTVGQAPATRPSTPATLPPSVTNAPLVKAPGAAPNATEIKQTSFDPTSKPNPITAKVPPEALPIYRSARGAAEWLQRVQNPVTGRFLYGWVPALNVPLDGDHFLHQAEATLALARAARYFGDDRYLLKARQAVLSLLAETRTDPNDPNVRYAAWPSLVVNRAAAAGLILAGIHELKEPADDLLQQGEQLANFIRTQQAADGSLRATENANDADGSLMYSAEALCGLMQSMRNRPAPWKLEIVRRALPNCRAAWKAHPQFACAGRLSGAFAEAFVRTREPAFAEFVFGINDWLCTLQFTPESARNPKWAGGFNLNGEANAPRLTGAVAAESLAEACRACRQVPDVQRYEKYKSALALSVQFLSQLQYTDDNTRHFAPNFREMLIGGFYYSSQDGNLSIDVHQHALSGMIQYLALAGER